MGDLVVQFGGNRARNMILKCEITHPITAITITNSWILRLRKQNTQSAKLP